MDKTCRLRFKLLTAIMLLGATTLCAQRESCRDTLEHQRLEKAMVDACAEDDPMVLEQKAADYQKHALIDKDLGAYYSTWGYRIIYLIYRMDIFNAYNLVQEMKTDMSQKAPDAEERFLVPNMLAQIYNACGNINGAMLEFKKALKLIKGTRYEATELCNLHLGLAHTYMNSKLKESEYWIDEDINELNRRPKDPRYNRNMANAYAFKAMLCFKKKDFTQFDVYKKLADDYEAKNSSGSSGSFLPYMRIYAEMLDGQRDQAHLDVGKLPNVKDHYIVWSDLLRYEGNCDEAFKCQRKLMHIRDSITGVMIMENIEQKDEELSLVRAKQEAASRANTILEIAIAMALLLIVLLMFYLYTRRAYQKTLLKKNRELVKANQRAMEADKMKREFISNVSHEIRTPLNIISGFSQVITADGMALNEEERSTIADTILRNTEHITSLVNKILALANDESTDILSQVADTDYVTVCREAIANMPMYDPARVNVSFDSLATEGTTLRTNADSLRLMLACLLENAVKFTDDGYIRLVCKQTDAGVQFVVEDTGCGISKDNAPYIFQRFAKIDNFKEGLGLGLAYCHETAEKLSGSLVLDPDYKDGCRFILTLPLMTN